MNQTIVGRIMKIYLISGKMRRKISSILILLLLTSCQYYISFWTPPEKIDLTDRKMYKNDLCMTTQIYDARYPLCPNQKCRNQLSKILEKRKKSYINYYKNNGIQIWNMHLKDCREKTTVV